MKTTRYFGFLILLLSGLFFVQCTSEPIVGPPGMDGINGVNGIDGQDGQDGQDGTASCVACHNNSHQSDIQDAFAVSLHANPNYLRSTGSCAQCHSHEGYVNYTAGKEVLSTAVASAKNCKTCHDRHYTFDFENDGQDYALRMIDPVNLMIDETLTLDLEGTSNNCIHCHQPRRAFEKDFVYANVDHDGDRSTPSVPALQEDGTILIGNHFGPHYGNQSTMYYGIGGVMIEGSEAYPGTGSTTHYNEASCVHCHMAPGTDEEGKEGLHSWHTNVNSCTTCHSSVPVMSDYQTLMDELGDILIENGLLAYDAEEDEYHEVVGANTTVKKGGALWNWIYIHDDQSLGVHNPAYIRALLKNSIEAFE